MKELFMAIAIIESSLNPSAVGDLGEVGIVQIQECVIEDVNYFYKTNYVPEDRYCIIKSEEIFNLYLSYWTSIAKKKGFEINNELRARIWNGGAYGYLKEGAAKENLDIYWQKVSQELE